MKILANIIRRDTKLFFKDKAMFFTSLITPLILLLLFVTFLGNVYRGSFKSCMPEGIEISDKLIEGFVGGWLFSSLLAVCCVTVAFCSNLLMVQDKANGSRKDLTIAPVKNSTLAIGYYISTAITTLVICFIALFACFIYLSQVGWYLTLQDVIKVIVDVLLLVMFGTALSSVINFFLSTQGQMAAVGTIVSSCYGFICGAYMPISQFSPAIQKLIGFLPGTYGTALFHKHLMGGVLRELEKENIPGEVVKEIGKAFDSDLEFFGHQVNETEMYIVVAFATVVLIGGYVLLNALKRTDKK